jgi:hypothetical protein
MKKISLLLVLMMFAVNSFADCHVPYLLKHKKVNRRKAIAVTSVFVAAQGAWAFTGFGAVATVAGLTWFGTFGVLLDSSETGTFNSQYLKMVDAIEAARAGNETRYFVEKLLLKSVKKAGMDVNTIDYKVLDQTRKIILEGYENNAFCPEVEKDEKLVQLVFNNNAVTDYVALKLQNKGE